MRGFKSPASLRRFRFVEAAQMALNITGVV